MDEARITGLSATVTAADYEQYTPELRRDYAETLACPACGQPAYFIRQSSNGRAACFGARPHTPGCTLATTVAGDDEPRLTARDEFVLTPADTNTADDPISTDSHTSEAAAGGPSRARPRRSGASRPALGLSMLLRRLVREPAFRDSPATIVLPDGTRDSIATLCVETSGADLTLHNQRRLYWGTIRYTHPDDDGAWFNLGRRGAPALRLKTPTVTNLLTRHQVDSSEGLQGASFLAWAFLRKSKISDRLYLFVDDLDWFALRLPGEDPL
jgi:hypothetical protein